MRDALLVATLLALPADQLLAYSPNDPAIKAMVDRGIAYIEANFDRLGQQSEGGNLGGRALLAYAIFKHRHQTGHPLVRRVVDESRQIAAGKEVSFGKPDYVHGVLITFLSELDDPSVNPLIAHFYEKLLKSQRPDGSWSYQARGDTSVTQYGMLASWAVRHQNIRGVTVPDASIEKAANWLLRTQAPSGAFGYAANDPGSYNRVPQDRTTMAMLAAGGGSLYMAADLLNFRRVQATKSSEPEFISSDAPVSTPGNPTTTAFPHKLMWDSLHMADRNWDQRYSVMNDGPDHREQYQYYYMYSMERYMSFRDKVLNNKEPDGGAIWYNQGVDYLSRTQKPDGSWHCKPDHGTGIDTAFATLFLLRSTKTKIITASAAGQARGGYGIPDSFQTARLTDDGEVVSSEKKDVVKDFTALLETLNAEEIPDNVDLSGLNQEWVRDKSKLEKLKEQVRSNPNYKARQLVVKQFASDGGIDNVPILIFALSDPAWQVVLEARNGLRRISHRIGGFGLSDNPTEAEKEEAQRRWSRWYLSVRPDGAL